MKKTNSNKYMLLGILLLQLIAFSPAAMAGKFHLNIASTLVQTENGGSAKSDNRIKSLLIKATKLSDLALYDSAMKLYDSAYKIAVREDNQLYANYTKRLKSTVFTHTGQMDSAKIYIIEAKRYAFQSKNDSLYAICQALQGYFDMLDGDKQACLDKYDSAFAWYEKNHDTINMGKVMNNYAIYYEEQGDYDKALAYALRFNSITKNGKELSKEHIMSLVTLGNIYDKLAEYDTALVLYERCYELCLKYNQKAYAQSALQNRAVIYYRQMKYDDAESAFKRAIYYSEQVNDKQTTALLYSNIGVVYRKLNKIDLAFESYKRSMEIALEINDETKLISVYNNLGVLYRNEKNYTEALKYYQKSLALAEKRNYKVDIKKAYGNIAILYEASGNYKEAFSNLLIANQWQDSVFSEEKLRAIEDMKAKYENDKNVAQIKSLQDKNRINALEKKSIRTERNSALGILSTLVFLLVAILLYFRMKSRKNRIIDAQRIQQLEDEKKLLAAQSVMVGQENERKRIAQELHDGIGVLLSTASIHFSVVSKTSKDKKTVEMLDKAEKLLKQAGGEVRKISQNMMPVVLSKFGLHEALEDMFEKLDEMDDLDVSTSFSGSTERLNENTEIMLYRIIQEMVNNTLKHAKAKHIEFSFNKGNGVLLIDYKDDGIGFELDKLPRNSSLGVYGIQSRVDFLNGKLKVESKLGLGTGYHITIPVIDAEN